MSALSKQTSRQARLLAIVLAFTLACTLNGDANAASDTAATAAAEGDTGVSAYYSGDYDGAIRLLQQALLNDPGNVNLRYYLADALVKRNRLQEARSEYRRIIDAMPGSRAGTLSRKALDRVDSHFGYREIQIDRIQPADLDWVVSAHIKDPTPDAVQRRLGNSVHLKGNPKEVTLAHLIKVKADIARLPYGMVTRFLDTGGQVYVVGSLMTVRHAEFRDNFDAAGLTSDDGVHPLTVYISVPGLDAIHFKASVNLTLHEMGHVMDMLAAAEPAYKAQTYHDHGYSQSDVFMTLYRGGEVQSFLKGLSPDAYFISAPEEGFAEMFAFYFNGQDTRSKLPLSVQDYFRTQVVPAY